MIHKSIKIHAQSSPNRPKWYPGALQKWSWKQVDSRLRKKALRLPRNLRFFAPLGRFWAPFGHQLGAKGSKNVRFWMGWTHRNALYISISVVFPDYDQIENFMKIDASMDPKSHPKIDLWAIRGSIFEVLGGFGRTLIFDEFWDVQKVDQKWQKFDT